ncbi:MAG: hypothetical protein IK095_00010 [Oscillospiraceae bacterium]|nr:hypothetical protein [Oscillospiraceae bacterium]
MDAYLRSYQTFHTLSRRDVLSWDLCRDAYAAENSSVTISGDDIPGSMAKNWLKLDGAVYLIGTVTPGKGTTKLTLRAPEEMFDRPLLYQEEAQPASIGAFIAATIAAGWTGQTDLVYATPYLQVAVLDESAFVPPETDEEGMWSLLDYIRAVRRSRGVVLRFSVSRDTLRIEIRHAQTRTHALEADDGHTVVTTSAFSASALAKISTIQPVDTGEVDEQGEKIYAREVRDWYLAADGSVSETLPASRAKGEWKSTVLSETDDPEEKVTELFAASNSSSHKIELSSDVEMAVGDRFRIRLNGEMTEGTVEAVRISSGESLPLYKSGELATTLTDKVRSISAGASVAPAAQTYAVGDVYITTRAGDPAQLLGYGAWEQLSGRFLFAADSQRPARARGGAEQHTLSVRELPDLDLPVKYNDSQQLVMTAAAASGSARTVPQITSGTGTLSAHLRGSGEAFSIMPPFYAVYVWIRKE